MKNVPQSVVLFERLVANKVGHKAGIDALLYWSQRIDLEIVKWRGNAAAIDHLDKVARGHITKAMQGLDTRRAGSGR